MATTAEAFALAYKCHQAGDLRQAEQLYQQVLQVEPHHAEAWFLLGEVQQGQAKPAEAALAYREALRLQPEYVEAHTNLGVTLAEQGKLEEAISHLRQALHLRPNFPKAHHNLGVALAHQGKQEEAAHSLRQALQFKPDYAEAYYNLGNVLMAQKKHTEAVEAFRQALRLRPGYYEVYNNLGLELIELGKVGEAAVVLRQAVRLRPNAAEAHNNLGLALAEQGKFIQAEASYEEALRISPHYADAHANLANTYKDQGRFEEALASHQLALWLQPQAASTHWNRSLVWLQTGDFEQGWPEYEWRWQRKQAVCRPFRQPRWDGSPLAGRTILLHMEQGLGDMLQFIRYAPLVQQRGGRVVVECPGFLVPLFSRCPGIAQLIAEGSPLPEFAVQVPLMSLPGLLGTTLETVPAQVPYLFADDAQIEHWRQRLAHLRAFKIGIAWQGNPHHKWDRHRSFPLAEFAPLARVPGVQLINLQRGFGTEQLHGPANRVPVLTLVDELDLTAGALMETAAIMKNLDLVVTTDTAVAHLAGALGVPVWVALSVMVDWRWLVKRTDSPWYPTMRLFRQSALGDWGTVFKRIAGEVRLEKQRRGS
jgi:tetratricopeptide (TPR) repeat protein